MAQWVQVFDHASCDCIGVQLGKRDRTSEISRPGTIPRINMRDCHDFPLETLRLTVYTGV
ncbi:MAG: hypothetical protein PUP92_39720 [Rhizonema sp. PD38]|nr:hypothetical protein [Rhizonema sp. PD38]